MSADFTFLKGNIETIILCSLYNKDMYGYELAKSIKERSQNKYEIKQPTLYSYLKRLEQDGYVYAYWGGESSGGRRRYYKLTEKGRADCEKFLAEWEYQRTVMGSLVDGTADVEPIGDASKLLGRKTPRKRKKVSSFDEQDEIARRLSELDGLSGDTTTDATTPPTETVVEVATTVVEPAPVVVEQPQVAPQEPTPTATQQAQLSLFDINQDDAETFISDFDKLANESSQKLATGTSQPKQGENYQHTLLNIIGDQLDEVQVETATTVKAPAIDNTAQLEEVADKFAREGIRLRIYNRATANFKSKTLIPLPEVICKTSWMTYLVALVVLGILCVTSIGVGNWLAPLITLAVLLILPVVASFYALANPIRMEKPDFNFKIMLFAAIILGAIVILVSVAISIFNHIELSNYVDIVNKILIPSTIALLPTAFILLFNHHYSKY
ncbi:MAG: PadR family transcriptional regulator [Clostridia bacterium]|nr:PadR family transcriptional regulator [Clostridia bacterium]